MQPAFVTAVYRCRPKYQLLLFLLSKMKIISHGQSTNLAASCFRGDVSPVDMLHAVVTPPATEDTMSSHEGSISLDRVPLLTISLLMPGQNIEYLCAELLHGP